MEKFLERVVELVAEGWAAADEEASDFAVGVDHDRLRYCSDGIFFGGGAVLIQDDGGLQVQTIEESLNGFGVFLHVDGDEFDMVGVESMDGLVDLRHGADAGTAPSGEEIEDDRVAFMFAELEFATVEQFQFEIGSGLADEGGFGSGRMIG